MEGRDNLLVPDYLRRSSMATTSGTQEDDPSKDSILSRFSSQKNKDLPKLSRVKKNKQSAIDLLIIQKLKQCCVVMDFSNPSSNFDVKSIKAETLKELTNFVIEDDFVITEPIAVEFINMIGTNIFRSLPFDDSALPDDEILEPAWPHINLIYTLFFKFLDMPNEKLPIVSPLITQHFIIQFLKNFNSGDSRERKSAKLVLHRLYGKFLDHRLFIRLQICNIFLNLAYENDSDDSNGISDLLEVFASIISGFCLPLKNEHKLLLKRIFIPLHIPHCLEYYYKQLIYCLLQYLNKDISLSIDIINGLIRYWPKTNSSKQVIFLSEIEEVIDKMDVDMVTKVHEPLFRTLASSVSSPNFLVSQRALLMYQNEYLINIINTIHKFILPIMVPVLYNAYISHWNASIIALIDEVLTIFRLMNKKLFKLLIINATKEYEKLQDSAK